MRNVEIMRSILEEPFTPEQIKRRKGGRGMMFDYIAGEDVIRRLNDATDGCWDLTIKDITQQPMGNATLVMAHVALSIPGMGTREHIGVQSVTDGGGEDLVKGAVTDALKKAATLFGVALHLYGDSPPAGGGTRPPQGRGAANGTPPRQQQARPQQAPAQGGAPQFTGQQIDDWNSFWPWARANGMPTKAKVEEALGGSMNGIAPAQLYAMLSGKGPAAGQPEPGQPEQAAPSPLDATRSTGWVSDQPEEARPGEPPCTQRQLGFLWRTGVEQFGDMAEEVLHALALTDYGLASLSDLTKRQASALIETVKDTDPVAILTRLDIDPARLETAFAPQAAGAGRR